MRSIARGKEGLGTIGKKGLRTRGKEGLGEEGNRIYGGRKSECIKCLGSWYKIVELAWPALLDLSLPKFPLL